MKAHVVKTMKTLSRKISISEESKGRAIASTREIASMRLTNERLLVLIDQTRIAISETFALLDKESGRQRLKH